MTRRLPLAALLVILPLAARSAPAAQAVLHDAGGKEVAKATFSQAKGGVRVRVVASALPPGKHGIHIHAAGKCEPPDFKTAGGHLNPTGKQHGLMNPAGHHAGDLPNLVVGKNGKAKATFVARGATLGEGDGSLLGPDGTALVIHEGDPRPGRRREDRPGRQLRRPHRLRRDREALRGPRPR
jgi:superoxide dismutase, Cu-Zn family